MNRTSVAIWFLVLVMLAPATLGFRADLDKIIYLTNTTMTVSGTSDYNTPVPINATLFTQAGASMSIVGGESDLTGAFSLSTTLDGFAAGDYYALVSDNNDNTLTLYFRVVEEKLFYKAFVLNSNDVYVINTSANKTNGGNFSDLVSSALSKSGIAKYGAGMIGSYPYHFALVDPDINGSYTKVWVDDDANFSIYENSEDTTGLVETEYKQRDIFNINGTGYVITDFDLLGRKLIVARALTGSSFAQGGTAYYLIVSENSAGQIVPEKEITVSVTSPSGVAQTLSNQTNDAGYYIGSLTLSEAGKYRISINEGMGLEFINVESYSVYPKIADLSGNPANSFSPGSTARITVISKSGSNVIALDSVDLTVKYPNGTTETVPMEESSEGNYYYDLATTEGVEGSYALRVTSSYGGNTQSIRFGLVTESSSFELMAINTDYLDSVEQGGEGVFVEAFAPGKNISFLAVRSDLSRGGFMGGEGGAVDIENTSANITCESSVSLVELKDNKDNIYPAGSLNYMIRSLQNVSDEGMLPQGVEPPQEMMRQCMIIIRNTSLPDGFYTLKAKLRTGGVEKGSATSFSIQRLLASGYTVDKNIQSFGLFAPNSVVNVKVKLTDMVTKNDTDTNAILNAKIIEMHQEYPAYSDVLSQMSNDTFNSSTGVLSFVSPRSEGFYSLKFRFKANMSGTIYEGIGSSFFELKKYIIFGEITQENEMIMGPSFKKPGDNLSLSVHVVDIDKGSLFDIGFSAGSSSQMSCTGCSGLSASVTRIFNEQLFREVNSSTYTVRNGSLTDTTSGATVVIGQLQDFDSGYYRVDLLLSNPADENETYTGWGSFEIRNFYVQAQEAVFNGTAFSSDAPTKGSSGESIQYKTGDPIYLRVSSMIPSRNGGEELEITSAEIVNVLKESNGPAVGTTYTGNLGVKTIAQEVCDYESSPPNCTIELGSGWIANISISDATDGSYIVNIRVNTSLGSDIGTAWVSYQSFQLDTTYRDFDSWWDPMYSSDELLNVTFTGSDFGTGDPRDLDFATATFISDKERGKPVKITTTIWNRGNTTCADNVCNAVINLSTLPAGKYDLEFSVNDTLGNTQSAAVRFELRNLLFSIPQLYQMFNGMSDTGDTGSINVNDNRDQCDNILNLRDDQQNWMLGNSYMFANLTEMEQTITMQQDTCPIGENNASWVCKEMDRFTSVPGIDKATQNYSSYFYCLNESTGFSVTIPGGNDACTGAELTLVGLVNNRSSTWVKYDISHGSGPDTPNYNMSGATQLSQPGDTLPLGPRSWVTFNASGGTEFSPTYVYKDTKNIRFNDGSKTWNLTIGSKPQEFTINHFCVQPDLSNIEQYSGNCGGGQLDLFIARNATHAIISYTTNLGGGWTNQGISAATNNQLAIIGLGYYSDGTAGPYVRVMDAANYGEFHPQGGELGSPDFMQIPRYYPTMAGNIFCVLSDNASNGQGQPRQWWNKENHGGDNCMANETRVFAFTNGTHVWFGTNSNNDLRGVNPTSMGADNTTGTIAGLEWSLASINVSLNMRSLEMKLSGNRLCGRMWPDRCDGQCQATSYDINPPNLDSSYAFGRINLITSPWMVQENFPSTNSTRYVYVYHNRTHLFMSSSTDFRGITGRLVTENITDPYGGQWTVKSLSDSTISLKGLNTLAGIGAYINMSYSQSGIVRYGFLREAEFGSSKGGARAGLDLNDNGLTNDTYYYVVSDASTPGVYDTFFFSNNANFTSPISMASNQTVRTFVNSAAITLTILSIDPRADRLLFYSNNMGDWSDIGDIAVGGNIRLPFIIQKPNGDAVAQASLRSEGVYKYDSAGAKQYIRFNTPVTLEISGTNSGEVVINDSNSGYTFTSGQYLFDISGNSSDDTFALEEWKWPRGNLRAFLTTNRMGKGGGWLSGFASVGKTVYGEQTGVRGLQLQSINTSCCGFEGDGTVFTGIAETARNTNSSGCGNFVPPSGANPAELNQIHESQRWQIYDPTYYFYFSGNATDAGIVWAKQGDCNFSDAPALVAGDSINFTQGAVTYMLEVLAVKSLNQSFWNPYALIGVNISDAVMKPVQRDSFDGSGRWRLLAIDLAGSMTNILLVNGSNNPMCGVWNGECISGAVFTTDGNYDGMDASDVKVVGDTVPGQADLYVSGLGPNSWEAISISNGSELPAGMQKPVFANLYVGDNTPIRVKSVNESVVGMDLNVDGDILDVFYITVFDDLSDSEQLLNRVLVDDDAQVTPMWQSQTTPATYYDYSGEEPGITEQWGGLPNAIWSGNLMFGPEQENETYRDIPWDQKAAWNIIMMNGTDMLISKESQCGIEETDSLKVIIRAYNFNQSNIVGANVSVDKIYRFGFMGGGLYPTSEYTSTTALTDSNGYALITIAPTSSWNIEGGMGSDYLLKVNVRNPGGDTTVVDSYARIGGECSWN